MHPASILDLETADSPVEKTKSTPNEVTQIESCNDKHSADVVELVPKTKNSSQASPQARKRDSVEPGKQPGAKRTKTSPASPQNGHAESSGQDTSELVKSAGSVTKETWQGFCEIQSEPAFFSTILKDMGVSNVKVEEVVSFRPELLELIPRPSYGLILLYRYRDQSSSDQPKEASSHVWFANQLPAQNSCATLAMINILMNNGDIEIGEHLQQFKEFTKDFNPYQRGEAFANFDFVKRIHNTFAKKMDILEADKHLSHKVKREKRVLNDKKARRKSTDSAATDDSAEGSEDNANHFIAFIPVDNDIWMLDGLNQQPTSIATLSAAQGQDWVEIAAASILALLDEDVENCTGFAIGPSPLPSLRKEACLALNHIASVDARLDTVSPRWRASPVPNGQPAHPLALGLAAQLPAYPTPAPLAATIAAEATHDLFGRRARVLADLNDLATSIAGETQREADDACKTAQARFDHAPVIKLWAQMLAANGYLERNLDRHSESKGGRR
ncbi:cysteine proteinase [Didymella exigua CBS 183.55]|uniref:ubiquitinyl hydrolase 1 n=1 Tax=Didymella exigua CBS 183.55 TaxID=1150837 RepID=A0A6A5RMM6_9PLEO|nr:cysteine proteinase [Didymella exigua CBS 183.55]KAF1928909.1 cysteine proteinase [Didymella exigua CBS 183.55]